MHVARFVLAVAVCAAAAAPSLAQPKPQKVAVLIGVGEFDDKRFQNLNGSPQKDVAELEKVLKSGGFTVHAYKDKQATKKNMLFLLNNVIGDGPNYKIRKGDVLLVAVCTHGFTASPGPGKPDEPFVVGYDSKYGDTSTMVPFNELLAAPQRTGATCLYLVDACREVADPNRSLNTPPPPPGIGGSTAVMPANTAVLFACKKGQLAQQPPGAGGHGLFTYAVLKAMRGEVGAGGTLTWNGLVAGVEQAFGSDEFKKLSPAGKVQTPVAAQGELESVELFAARKAAPLKGGETSKDTQAKRPKRDDFKFKLGEEKVILIPDQDRIPPGLAGLTAPIYWYDGTVAGYKQGDTLTVSVVNATKATIALELFTEFPGNTLSSAGFGARGPTPFDKTDYQAGNFSHKFPKVPGKSIYLRVKSAVKELELEITVTAESK